MSVPLLKLILPRGHCHRSGRIPLVYFKILIAASLIVIVNQAGAACVWKVTSGPNVLYLGGSIHALKSKDYPLPAAYNRAFDASDRLVCEVDPKALLESSKGILKAGEYPKGDSLKNHVDPRTYDYLRRVFKLLNVPESKFARYRPWFLSLVLQAPALHGMSETLGVEEFLLRRARANSKPVSGLESAREHADVFLGLTDHQSEAMLLMMFLPTQRRRGSTGDEIARAWRRGDADTDTRIMLDEFRNFPSLADRFLTDRNRKWIPKIEAYLQSGKTYFVVAGAAHMGGPNGIIALLRDRGYHIEEL
ncbi:MAG: TraB/GumN family protein [Bryobacteraceae bacterium]